MFFLGGQVLQLGEEKNEDAKVTKGFLGGKVDPNWHFIIHQIMGQILNFSTSPLTSHQIWPNLHKMIQTGIQIQSSNLELHIRLSSISCI